jgi:hypothetical protein
MPRRTIFMLLGIALAVVFALTASVDLAHAQSGHFVGDVTCRDAGLQLVCTGKAAGLGGTTFEITVTADGIASVECTNPGGNVAPGQSFSFTAEGTTGSLPTPRNGQYRFSVPTVAPTAPAGSCPNEQWTPDVVDVTFTEATVTLSENGAVSDEVTVSVP